MAVVVIRAAAGLSTVSGGARPRRPKSSTHAAGRRRSLARAARRRGVRTRGGGGGGDRRTDGCRGGIASRIAFPSFPHTGKERKGRGSTRGGDSTRSLGAPPLVPLLPCKTFPSSGSHEEDVDSEPFLEITDHSVGSFVFPGSPNEQQHEVEFFFIGERICSGSTRLEDVSSSQPPPRGARRPRQGAPGPGAGRQARQPPPRGRPSGVAVPPPPGPRGPRPAHPASGPHRAQPGGGRALRGSSRPGRRRRSSSARRTAPR